jgi:MSHA biogenesis protein MshK
VPKTFFNAAQFVARMKRAVIRGIVRRHIHDFTRTTAWMQEVEQRRERLPSREAVNVKAVVDETKFVGWGERCSANPNRVAIRGIGPASSRLPYGFTLFAPSRLRVNGFDFALICIAVLLLLSGSPVAASENMRDPMRPPTGAAAVERASSEPRWKVTGILISPERRLAMINDRLIAVGGKVDGARVRNINSNSVELDIDGRSVVLRPVTASLRRDE